MNKIIFFKTYTAVNLIGVPLDGRKCILNFNNRQTYFTPGYSYTQRDIMLENIPGLKEELQNDLGKKVKYTSFKIRQYDVISCQAPSSGSYRPKLKIILNAMEEHGIEYPIIGWWGCDDSFRRIKKQRLLQDLQSVLAEENYHFKAILWPTPEQSNAKPIRIINSEDYEILPEDLITKDLKTQLSEILKSKRLTFLLRRAKNFNFDRSFIW